MKTFNFNEMKRILSLFAIFFVTLLISCSEDVGGQDQDKNIRLDEKSSQLIEADNAFGLEIFQKIVGVSKEDNVMISPLSISVALAMVYNGADGDTKTEMEQTLKMNGLTTDQINATYAYLIGALKSLDPDVVFEIADAIFYRNGFPFKEDFINVNKDIYDAEVAGLDFQDPGAVNTINNWVAGKTHNKIPTIINQLDPYDVMVLLNAVYFNGIWQNKFDEKGTHELDFHKADGTVIQVPMMNKEDKVDYVSNDLFSAVRMPYGAGQYNMVVFLPDDGKTTNDVISALTVDTWKTWMESFEMTDHVVITMPRFKYAFELKLNDVLSDMGMVKAFSSQNADFSKISDQQLYISSVMHKSYIDVNENGTEAAAVTSVTVSATSIGVDEPKKTYFTVNRPFVYAITEKDTGAILFMGRVALPVYAN